MNTNFAECTLGDILFVTSKSRYIAYAQRFKYFTENSDVNPVVEYRKFNYTHVILSLGKGIFIDSTINRGVNIFTLEKLINDFKNEYDKDFEVFRYKNLTEIQKEMLFKKAEFYLFEGYNLLGVNSHKKRKGKSYCSELISNIYNDAGIRLNMKYKTHPIHLYQELLSNNLWEANITEYYKNIINQKNKLDVLISKQYINILELNILMNTLIIVSNIYTSNFKVLPETAYFTFYPKENYPNVNFPDIKEETEKTEILMDDVHKSNIFQYILTFKEGIVEALDTEYIKDLDANDFNINWMMPFTNEIIKTNLEENKNKNVQGMKDLIKIIECYPKIFCNVMELYKEKLIEKDNKLLQNLVQTTDKFYPSSINLENELDKLKKILDNDEFLKIEVPIDMIYKLKNDYKKEIIELTD